MVLGDLGGARVDDSAFGRWIVDVVVGTREGTGHCPRIGRVLGLSAAHPQHAIIDGERTESEQHDGSNRRLNQNRAAFGRHRVCAHAVDDYFFGCFAGFGVALEAGASTAPPPPSSSAPTSPRGGGRKRPGRVGSGGTSSGSSA